MSNTKYYPSEDNTASEIEVDASGFNNNLSETDTDVQTALETLDAMSGGSAHTIQNNGTPLTQRAKLNVLNGLKAVDDAGNNATKVETDLHSATEKTSLLDADEVIGANSASSFSLIRTTWTNVKAFLKTYFDTLYNNYIHPNHSGEVTSVADGAQTITNGAVSLAKMSNMATNSFIGRKTAGAGVPEILSKTDALGILNVEDGADVTDSINVDSAGAVMESDYNANTILAANADNIPLALEIAVQRIIGRITDGNIAGLTDSQVRTLINVADGATANTKATGAEINTGTDDVKFATPKAIFDSNICRNQYVSVASSATPTPTVNDFEHTQYDLTALAEAATFGAPTTNGTLYNGQKLLIRIKDNGTARTLDFNAIYRAIGVTLPTTTTISKTQYLGAIYNSADTKWDVIAKGEEV